MDIPKPPKQLLEEITKENCFVFIGAGLSQGAGLPGWKQLLLKMTTWGAENGVKLADRSDLETAISNGDFLGVAEELRERFGDQKFRRFLREEFQRPMVAPTDAHHFLPKIPFTAAITFNYDKLLEATYTLKNGYEPPVFTQQNKAELSNALRSRDFFILKAHGTIDDIETIVLGRKDYRELVNGTPAYQQFLKSYFSQKTALFVGISLSDPDICLLLEELKVVFNNYTGTHYALMDVSNILPFQLSRYEKDYSIEIIPYQATLGHPEVRGFLKTLADYDLLKKAAFRSVLQSNRGLDNDPNYRLVANTKGEVMIEAKHPQATKEHPIRIIGRLRFDTKTPEGKESFEEYKRHLATGSPVTIKGEYIEKLVPPDLLKPFIGYDNDVKPMMLAIVPNRGSERIFVKLETTSSDGETASIDNIELNISQQGNEELTLDNGPQPIPFKLKVTVKKPFGPASISIDVNYTGINVWQALQQARFLNVLSKAGKLHVRNFSTGMIVDEVTVPIEQFHAGHELWLNLLESLFRIQDILHQPINTPTPPITIEEVNDIFWVERTLETGHATSTSGPWVVEMNFDQAKNLLETFRNEERVHVTLTPYEPFKIRIRETEIVLGQFIIQCSHGFISNSEADKLETALLKAKPGDIFEAEISRAEDAPCEVLFVDWLPEKEQVEVLKHPGVRKIYERNKA